MLASDFPLIALTGQAEADGVVARVAGRSLAVAQALATWAGQRGIGTGGRLLATLELHPDQAGAELGWGKEQVAQAAAQLRELFSRLP